MSSSDDERAHWRQQGRNGRLVRGLVLLLLVVFAQATPAQARVVLTASNWAGSDSAPARAMHAWCEEAARVTSGRVSCRILPQPVVPAPQTFDAVRSGLVDLAYSAHAYTPERYRLTRIAELPFLSDSALVGSVAFQRIYERHLARFNEHQGLHVLAVFTHGPGMIFSRQRAIRTSDDLRALEFQASGGMAGALARALGLRTSAPPAASRLPVPQWQAPPTPAPTASADAVLGPASTPRVDAGMRYRTRVPGGLYNTSFAFVMNPDAWARIPRDDRERIESVSGELVAARFGIERDAAERRSLAAQQSIGMLDSVAPAPLLAQIRRQGAVLDEAWISLAARAGLADAREVLRDLRREIAALDGL